MSPYLPPQAELPFAPIKRRYEGYSKYSGRIQTGIELYSTVLHDAVDAAKWDEIGPLLEKGSKSKGNSKDKEGGTGVAASDLRSSCRAYGLFANTVLQSENDSGSTTANLLARHLVNEVYFSMDDIADAAKAKDKAAAKAAWNRARSTSMAICALSTFQSQARWETSFRWWKRPFERADALARS